MNAHKPGRSTRVTRSNLRAAPPVILFLFLTVSWGVSTWALGFLSGTSSLTVHSIVGRVIGGVLFGAAMTALLTWQRRRAGGVAIIVAIDQAAKSGMLPADATAEVWLPLLRRKERSLVQARLLNPIVFGAFTLLGVLFIVLGGRSAVLGWLSVVLFVGMGIWSVISMNRDLPKVRSLIAQLAAVQEGR